MSARKAPQLPYRWTGKGKQTEPVDQAVADALEEPREVETQTVIFSFHADDVVDHTTRELALLLGQASAWLLEHDDVTVLGVWWDTAERVNLYLSVE